MKQIKELTKNNQNNGNIQIINNNVMRQKPLITRRKVMKKNKKTIKDNNNFNGIFNISYNRNNNPNFSERKHQSGFETDFNFNKNNEEKNTIFNIEEILMMEEKLSSLINCLRDCNPCSEECFEFLNFYFTTKLSKNLNTYFTNKNYLIIIKRTINLKLFSFILCYDISLNENIFHQYIVSLDELFGYIHNILILLSKYFCNKIIESNDNIWVKKLQNLIDNFDPEKKQSNIIFEEIDNLCFKLTDNLFPFILQKYNHEKVIEIYNELNTLTQIDLYRLFRDNIFINMNINGSIIASSSYFEKNKNNFISLPPIPYLVNKSNKKYTLVLDLDETLIHFKVNPNNNNSGILQFRPYISEFLSNIKDFYELIVFTAATKEYADPIIDAIEQKGIKFDHRLYRIHTIIRGNDFVKDLSKLGRDLGRIIIVDNMEQNYKLQPYNGITIRPFWGKDTNDMALFDLLNILIKIVKMDMDIRDGIRYFKEEIISRVTSNIFRRVQK
jgi:Dullard-like phosphatase family protein